MGNSLGFIITCLQTGSQSLGYLHVFPLKWRVFPSLWTTFISKMWQNWHLASRALKRPVSFHRFFFQSSCKKRKNQSRPFFRNRLCWKALEAKVHAVKRPCEGRRETPYSTIGTRTSDMWVGHLRMSSQAHPAWVTSPNSMGADLPSHLREW